MDYPYIRAWGEQMGSHRSYILDQVSEARKEKAPEDAFYRSADTGEWVRWKDFNGSVLTRGHIESRVAELKEAA